jgi:hypothetical protein
LHLIGRGGACAGGARGHANRDVSALRRRSDFRVNGVAAADQRRDDKETGRRSTFVPRHGVRPRVPTAAGIEVFEASARGPIRRRATPARKPHTLKRSPHRSASFQRNRQLYSDEILHRARPFADAPHEEDVPPRRSRGCARRRSRSYNRNGRAPAP